VRQVAQRSDESVSLARGIGLARLGWGFLRGAGYAENGSTRTSMSRYWVIRSSRNRVSRRGQDPPTLSDEMLTLNAHRALRTSSSCLRNASVN